MKPIAFDTRVVSIAGSFSSISLDDQAIRSIYISFCNVTSVASYGGMNVLAMANSEKSNGMAVDCRVICKDIDNAYELTSKATVFFYFNTVHS